MILLPKLALQKMLPERTIQPLTDVTKAKGMSCSNTNAKMLLPKVSYCTYNSSIVRDPVQLNSKCSLGRDGRAMAPSRKCTV